MKRFFAYIPHAMIVFFVAAPFVIWAGERTNRGSDPFVINTTLTTANTEVCYTAPHDIHGMDMRARNGADLKMSFSVGTSGTVYFTIVGGTVYYVDKMVLSNTQIVCWQSATAVTIVEMVVWR